MFLPLMADEKYGTNKTLPPAECKVFKKTKESFCTEKYRRIFQSVISGQKDDDGQGN